MTTRMAATILMMAGGLLLASPIAAAQHKEAGVTTTTTKPAFTNHLAKATSPYLLQHQHNPVDWYEWGPEALDLARREDKPIFLSIGYAACHWCHVMAHESFESPEIAAIMNRNFVNIKVDREERPDLDDLYMQATQIVNRGQGGWPMSVWLTPDLKPFYAGTYFPPAARWGRPGFGEICERFGEAWRTQRAELIASADQLANLVRDQLAPSAGDGAIVDLALVDKTADFLTRAFDAQRGGMSGGGTNKFPPSMALEVMLRAAHRKPADDPQRRQLIALVELTLDEMARGGIFDQLAGGFHRYSTDVEWLVPHFEKMLYDQALVSRSYLDAFQLTGNPEYAAVARRIFDYVLADLQSPDGGFYSTRDADSEGEEGKYYVWTKDEVVAAVGPQDADLFCRFYDITERGNWDDPHFPGVPKNIPRIKTPLAKFAIENKLEPTDLERRLAAGRAKLLAIRAKRVAPGLDDKILCEWNGMMIASLARGGAVLDEPRYLEAARRAADFVLTRQWRDGRLLRSWRAGRTLSAAFLTDYACLIEGLLDLYEATLEPRWFAAALELNAVVIREYWDESGGAFFFTAHDHEQLLTRNKDLGDGATPSGNSVQLMNLLRLSAMLGDEKLRTLAERTMRCFAGDLAAAPWSAERFLCGVDFAFVGPTEIALIGPPAAPAMRDLRRVIGQTYLPNKVVVGHDPVAADSAGSGPRPRAAVDDQPAPIRAASADPSRIDPSRARKEAVAGDVVIAVSDPQILLRSPLLADRSMIGNQPTAYVCRNYVCQKPVKTPDELKGQLSPVSTK